jgi:hypothetical protein
MRVLAVFFGAVAAVAVAACNSGDGPDVADTVTRVSGDSQTVYVGKQRTAPMVVVVRHANGSPFNGAGVNWSIVSGGGSLDSAILVTGADGLSKATYTSSDTAGTAVIRAVSGRGTQEFSIKKLSDTLGILTAVSGNGSATLVGSPVKLIAKAGDKYGNPIANVAITWSTAKGTLSATTGTTDTLGLASTQVTVGPTAGTYSVSAASKLNNVTFSLTAVQGPSTP